MVQNSRMGPSLLTVTVLLCVLDVISCGYIPAEDILLCGNRQEIVEYNGTTSFSLEGTDIVDPASQIVSTTKITFDSLRPTAGISLLLDNEERAFIGLSIDRLSEEDVRNHSIYNTIDLTNQTWDISHMDHISCSGAFFKTVAPNGVVIEVLWYIFKEDSSFRFGNKTINIDVNTPKFSIIISNYPYESLDITHSLLSLDVGINLGEYLVLPKPELCIKDRCRVDDGLFVTLPLTFHSSKPSAAIQMSFASVSIRTLKYALHYTRIIENVTTAPDKVNIDVEYLLPGDIPLESSLETILALVQKCKLKLLFKPEFDVFGTWRDVIHLDPSIGFLFEATRGEENGEIEDKTIFDSSGLSGGSIAAIVVCSTIGVLVLVSAVLIAVFIVLRKKKAALLDTQVDNNLT